MIRLILPLLFLSATALAQTSGTWELRDGRWQAVASTQPTTAAAFRPDPKLDRIERLLENKRWKTARTELLAWLKDNAGSPQRDRALYLFGQVYYQGDDRVRAFYHFDELLEVYPESRLFYPALEMQYRIADEYLNGYKETFLGLRVVSREDEGVEMLYRIQQTSPGSPLAERALLRTADYYYADEQYDLAADAYAMYVKSYPRSPLVSAVLLRRAYSTLAQFRGKKFDPTPMIDARQQMLDLMRQYPQQADEENLPAVVDRIDRTFANKMLYLADFHRRTKQPVASAYVYRLLIKTYPQSPEAADAQAALQKLPKSALETPDPPGPSMLIPSDAQVARPQ